MHLHAFYTLKKTFFLGQEVPEMLTDIARFFYPNLQQFRLDLENILLFSLKKFPEIKVKLFASYFNFKKASGAIVDKNTTLNIYYKSLTR